MDVRGPGAAQISFQAQDLDQTRSQSSPFSLIQTYSFIKIYCGQYVDQTAYPYF